MKKRLSRFGVGPRIMVSALTVLILMWWVSTRWPEAAAFPGLPRALTRWLGAALLAIGVPMWFVSIAAVMRAYRQDRLVTDFGVVRHPVYSAWIVFNFPGIAFAAGYWPMLLATAVAALLFVKLIRVEDEYLAQRFGSEYQKYRDRVPALIPFATP